MKFFFLFICLLTCFKALADGHFTFFRKDGEREVHIYLPEEYASSSKHYPVLYMHDGQNVYDPQRGYLGQTWQAERTLNLLIRSKKMRPIIVVAIDNTPDRTNEYTQDYDPSEREGGEADNYLSYIVNDLKPDIDKYLRTKTDRNSTGIMGSSLGGLVSLYAGIKYSQNFGMVAALSPSLWWNSRSIFSLFKKSSSLPLKIYLDSGTVGGERPQDVRAFSKLLLQRGFETNSTLLTLIQSGAAHSETYWAQRLPGALTFLYQN